MDKLNQFGFSDKNFASQKGHTKPQPTQPGYGQRTHAPSQPLKQQTSYGGKPSGYGQRPKRPLFKSLRPLATVVLSQVMVVQDPSQVMVDQSNHIAHKADMAPAHSKDLIALATVEALKSNFHQATLVSDQSESN